MAYFAKRARFGPVFQQRLLDASDGETFEGLNETYTFENRTEDGRFRLTDSDGVTHVRTAEEFTDREVVARIRSAMPYYDMAPRIITQFARRLPVGPDFLTFHFESVRCGVNNYRNAIHDLKHFGDVQPMIGTILAHSVAATRASAKWAPLALAAAATMRALGGREPDAEEEDALRDIMPPYRARNVMLVGKGEGGRYPYVDIGYLHPYDLFSTVAMAMQAPDGRKLDTLADGLGEFFWGGTMAGKLFAHLMMDTDEFGRPLVSDLDQWWERLGDRAKYAFEALEPQTFLELAMMVEVMRAGGEELLTRDGEVRAWGQHLTRATTPLRVRRLKVADALRARAAALHRTVADKKSEGNRAWREFHDYGYSTEARAREAVRNAQDRLYEVATPILQRLVDAARQLGMTEEEIRTQLRDAGFGKSELDTFFSDGYLPYTSPPVQ